ncbi:PfaD family polyunsaturated fatty acid/polyketide biosynthesis protein [Sorlinia euscelidii]|uniref:PfaD family protein n=2 Tax=Sorlinia euscelidii TaxID=3081148 RepID=A0ABU7U1A4_9PROT
MTFFDYDILKDIWLLDSAGNTFYINEKLVTPARLENSKVVAVLPDVRNRTLGAAAFCNAHHIRHPYIGGEMANGIASEAMVKSLAQAGLLGFFGAAGLAPGNVEKAIINFKEALGAEKSWGVNLIHAPGDQSLERALVALFLKHGVRRVSASAFMSVTAAVVQYAASGLEEGPDGAVMRKNFVFAKVSRPEIARIFLSPAPQEILDALVAEGALTSDEARLARRVPIAENITVEADSGGHTDNRPLSVILPLVLGLREELRTEFAYSNPVYVGAAGGLGTPEAIAASFAMGADYVLTGSVNQSAIEAGISTGVKSLLAKAKATDMVMAPSADMFEIGAKVQVLKSGTMFAIRAQKLFDLYQRHTAFSDIPEDQRKRVEKEIFNASLTEIWDKTRQFWEKRNAKEVERALKNPRYQMALTFRWYLGLASHWAIQGETSRALDYQIWCGPAMGAFNEWVKGSFLEDVSQRNVAQIGRNLMLGAMLTERLNQLRLYGVHIPPDQSRFRPVPLDENLRPTPPQ